MSSVSLSNVLLPAVFISSAVFTTLTLPFALIKSEPVVVEIPPYFSGEIQPIFNGEHKEVAIPYVGFAIVVSVGAGIACVEVNRRWQAYRESAIAQEQSQNLQQNSKDKEAQQEALNLPEYRPEASAIDLSLKDEVFRSQSLSVPNAMTEATPIAVEAHSQVVDATQLGLPQPTTPHQTTALAATLENQNLSQAPDGNNSVHLVSSGVGQEAAVQDLDIAFSKILESRHLYQTCRIKVPHLERRLFAILVDDGQYYSFFRAEKTKEKVQDIMAKIGHQLQKTVITKTEKGYVIWTWEPEISSKISS
jgi:hypothetical protein